MVREVVVDRSSKRRDEDNDRGDRESLAEISAVCSNIDCSVMAVTGHQAWPGRGLPLPVVATNITPLHCTDLRSGVWHYRLHGSYHEPG